MRRKNSVGSFNRMCGSAGSASSRNTYTALVIDTPPQIIEATRLVLQKFAEKYHIGKKWELRMGLEFWKTTLEQTSNFQKRK
jgi:hypothetical protein